MATVFWTGNSPNFQQVDLLTVTVAANGGTITATMGVAPYSVSMTYTMSALDTTATAAAALAALLSGGTAPAQFQDATYSVTNNVITCTAAIAGTPFTLAASSGAGATMTHSVSVANVSQSDVANAANWNRAGSAALPQNTDDMLITDSAIPLLWNLDQLAAVQLNSYTRNQSFTGTVGLPTINPLGYLEYRPTYFQFTGSGGGTPLKLLLGEGVNGSGPTRERYNVGTQKVLLTVLGSGGAQDNYAILFLGTNAANALYVMNTSVGVAVQPGEVATIASATVDGAGTLALGSGVTFSGTLTATSATVTLGCAPASVVASGSQVTVNSAGLTYTAISGINGTTFSWLSDSSVMVVTLHTNSTFDKSGDPRPITITNSTIDGDSCQVIDGLNAITWTNPTTINNQVFTGPFVTGAGRTIKVV